MPNLVVSCVVVARLSANVHAIVKAPVFELARPRKHLLLDARSVNCAGQLSWVPKDRDVVVAGRSQPDLIADLEGGSGFAE